MKKSWWQEVRALVSLVAFVAGAAFVFQSLEIAVLITAALGIHELGHVLAISLFGVDWHIGFGISGAWTRTPTNERAALTHGANAVIHLAGPLFNLLYALLALGIDWAYGPEQNYWLRVANISATVGLFNVLPVGRVSDGGKVMERTFSALDERAERWLLPAPVLWLFSLLWLVTVVPYDWIGILAYALIGLWFIVGMLLESLRDDRAKAASPGGMTRNQGFLLISSILILMLASTMVVLLTPLWLTEDHVLGMVGGLARTVIRPLFTWLRKRFEMLQMMPFSH